MLNKSLMLTVFDRFFKTYTPILFIIFSSYVLANSAPNAPHTPERLQEIPKNFKKVGSARFSFLVWDVYDSRLFTLSGKYSTTIEPYTTKINNPILFEITYLRDITNNDLINNTVEQWEHLSITKNTYQAYIPQLEALWPNIKTGDILSLLIDNERSHFYYNNKLLGDIANSGEVSFGELFLNIWLSPQTSQPELRQKLLGITK